MKNKKCDVCHKEVYTEIGKGCKLCGMPLDDESKEFCSKDCRRKYIQIHGNHSTKIPKEIITEMV